MPVPRQDPGDEGSYTEDRDVDWSSVDFKGMMNFEIPKCKEKIRKHMSKKEPLHPWRCINPVGRSLACIISPQIFAGL